MQPEPFIHDSLPAYALPGGTSVCTEALPAYKQPVPRMTYDDPEIIYYGPHACSNCGATICKMALEFGGNSFTYPDDLIYPNTIWHPHVCDPKRIASLPKAAA